MKCCTKCETPQPTEMFANQKGTPDGLRYWCRACSAQVAKMYREANKDASKARRDRYAALNKDRLLAARKLWWDANKTDQLNKKADYYEQNKAVILASRTAYYEKNKESIMERNKTYKNKNRTHYNGISKERKEAQRCAVPSWADRPQSTNFYLVSGRISKLTGIKMNIDHIVPLKSPLFQSLDGNTVPRRRFVGPLLPVVQGLHCPDNFQILDSRSNTSKSNRTWPDMPSYQGMTSSGRKSFSGMLPLRMPANHNF